MTTIVDRYKEEIKSLNDEIETLKHIIHTRATPSADTLEGLVRYEDWFDCFNNGGMRKDPHGEYVRYSEAAAVVAAERAEKESAENGCLAAVLMINELQAELAETKTLLQNERDQQVHEELAQLKAKLAQHEAQEPVGYAIYDKTGFRNFHTANPNISPEDLNEYEITITPLYAAPVSDSLKAENERLREALGLCQRTLAMLIDPKSIVSTTSIVAFASATEAEAKARAALKGDSNDKG